MFWFKSIIAIILSAILGSFLSKKIQMEAISYYWAIVPAVLSGLIWGRMAQNKSNLIYSSVVFDVTLSISYVVALRYFGERLSPMQCVGALVSIFGIFLIGRG